MRSQPSILQLLIGTFIHRVPFREAKRCLQRVESYSLPLSYTDLAAHHLAGGRISSLVDGMIYARENGIKMSTTNAQARDLVAAQTTKLSLTEHIHAFEAIGVRDLDSAYLDPHEQRGNHLRGKSNQYAPDKDNDGPKRF